MAVALREGGYLALEAISLIDAIRKWWEGKITITQLIENLGSISQRIMDRYFNTEKKNAILNAYKELSVPSGTKDRTVIIRRYKELAAIHHPDKGGNTEKMQEITVARDIILESFEEEDDSNSSCVIT